MNENETKIVTKTNNYNVSHEINSRENLDELGAPLNQAEADRLGYARVLTPEDYIDRTPRSVEEKRTLGKSILGLFGKK